MEQKSAGATRPRGFQLVRLTECEVGKEKARLRSKACKAHAFQGQRERSIQRPNEKGCERIFEVESIRQPPTWESELPTRKGVVGKGVPTSEIIDSIHREQIGILNPFPTELSTEFGSSVEDIRSIITKYCAVM